MYYTIHCNGVKKVREFMQDLPAPETIPADCSKKEG